MNSMKPEIEEYLVQAFSVPSAQGNAAIRFYLYGLVAALRAALGRDDIDVAMAVYSHAWQFTVDKDASGRPHCTEITIYPDIIGECVAALRKYLDAA